MTNTAIYSALFTSSFLAATLVPAQSELGLAYLIGQEKWPLISLIAVASLGNIMGAMVNWYLGTACLRFQDKKWFPVSPSQLIRAQGWYQRFGKWSLLLSWAPIIGDPITLMAGVLRTPFWVTLALVTIAKTARYIMIALFVLSYV